MTNIDKSTQFRRDQMREHLVSELEQTLDDRINRFIEVDHQQMLANHHFTQASRECHKCYRDGHYIAAIMLAQSVAEGILKFMVEKTISRLKQTKVSGVLN